MRSFIGLAAAAAVVWAWMSPGCQAGSEPASSLPTLPDALVRYAKLDYPAAHRMLAPLADDGNAVAQELLGFMYAHGEGVPHDDTAALRWFTLAAKAGRVEAQFELGRMYR